MVVSKIKSTKPKSPTGFKRAVVPKVIKRNRFAEREDCGIAGHFP